MEGVVDGKLVNLFPPRTLTLAARAQSTKANSRVNSASASLSLEIAHTACPV